MNRRTFLRKSLIFSSGFIVSSRFLTASDSEPIRWAFFSDTHIPADPTQTQGPFRLHDNLREVVRQILGKKVEGAIITGDLARKEGLPEDYQALRSLIEPLGQSIPIGLAPGNHDHRKNFLSIFDSRAGSIQPVSDRLVTIFETPVFSLVLLDSLLDTHVVPGFLGKLQREWLTEYLNKNHQKPVLLFLHHNLTDGDDSLLDADRLLRIMESNPQVKGIFYGHTHRFEVASSKGLHFINLPAVAYNFSVEQPVGWVEAALTPVGGVFKLHAIAGNSAVDGKTVEVTWR